jgi:hypothetical protein
LRKRPGSKAQSTSDVRWYGLQHLYGESI